MKKPYPNFNGDDEAEQKWLDGVANLDEYDLVPDGVPMREWLARYEPMRKDQNLNLRLPAAMLEAINRVAEKRNIPTQRLVRQYLERGLKDDAA